MSAEKTMLADILSRLDRQDREIKALSSKLDTILSAIKNVSAEVAEVSAEVSNKS